MVIGFGNALVQVIQQVMGWNDIHNRQAGDTLRRVQRYAVGHPSAAIMSGKVKPCKTQR